MRNIIQQQAVPLIALVVASAAVLAAGLRQMESTNLSPTAGGQYPYLVYAYGFQREGLLTHAGDRNRMPLVPALLAMVTADADAEKDDPIYSLFLAGRWLALGLNVASVIVIGLVALLTLSRGAAAIVTLTGGLAVMPNAAFLQADTVFLALFFAAFVGLAVQLRAVEVGRRIPVGVGVLVGGVAGLAFLAKGAAYPMVALFAVGMVVVIAQRGLRGQSMVKVIGRHEVVGGLLALVVFCVVIGPYALHNMQRFGAPMYNVNSTFFMWFDRWPEAAAFAARFDLAHAYPNLPAEEVPSLSRYVRTHTVGQMVQRLVYGLRELGWLALNKGYLLVLAGAVLLSLLTRWHSHDGENRRHRVHAYVTVFFCGSVIAGYALLYAWYVPIGYGERFVLTLLLPTMWWLLQKPASAVPVIRWPRAVQLGAACLFFGLLGGLSLRLARASDLPDEVVQFWYNETIERQQVGDLREAERGLVGVLSLRPNHVGAVRGLGVTYLLQQRFDEALSVLHHAAQLDPGHADTWNGMGAALIQLARDAEAIEPLQRAVALDPAMVSGWVNLTVAYANMGDKERAREAVFHVEHLAPETARAIISAFELHE